MFREERIRSCSPALGVKPLRSLSMAAISVAIAANPAPAQDGLSFFDGFSTFDRSRWTISDGWTNGGYQNCTWLAEQVDLSDGLVIFRLEEKENEERSYACAEINTHDRFGYGTFEASLKTGTGSGMNAAFFTYIGPIHKSPHHEIDFEILTRDPSRVGLNTYVNGEPQNGKTVEVPSGANSDFTHYAFVWEPDRIRWYVDGMLVHTATENLPIHSQKIFFSLWGSDTLTSWMGPFEYPGHPVRMEIDWVAYTASGEVCAFPKSITCDIDAASR